MKYDPSRHHRRSIRLPTYDYASRGAYFLTLCTFQGELLFGSIIGEAVALSPLGHIVEDEWIRSEAVRQEIELDQFVVMPNHLHAVVWIARESHATNWATAGSPYIGRQFALCGPGKRTVSSLVGGFKSAVTRRINEWRDTPGSLVWQRDFYERVLRNESELERARQYILDNPRKWAEDKHNPANQPESQGPSRELLSGLSLRNHLKHIDRLHRDRPARRRPL
jgi:REP element-mobilizing transposase RayT